MSIYSFKPAFWLNLLILCTFFNTNPWFNVCFKFLMCITHSSSSFGFISSFSSFLIFIVWGKGVNHCGSYVKFPNIQYQLQEIILCYFRYYSLLNLMPPTDSKHNFYKMGIKILATHRIQSRTHNHNTMFNHKWWKS